MKTLDWKKYEETARRAIAEGCVLLENKNQVLPLPEGTRVSIFGRIQNEYYKSGTGSGGMVNVDKVYNIVEGLEESNWVEINKDLQKIYTDWEQEHPYDSGMGWGNERWSQDEMPLTEKIVADAAEKSDTAIVIIGRTAGEDKDNSTNKGSYLLNDDEFDMLKKVRGAFKKMVVLLNVGNIIDMSFAEDIKPDSIMYVWQGGMLGGLGTADALIGKTAPCGKLTDTIAKQISDYPSDKYFGCKEKNFYSEDIFVGYRYFETFAKDKVLYPFGYGLTYTTFTTQIIKAGADITNKTVELEVKVTNNGDRPSKESVQIYIQAPDGKLGKADRVLADFNKTKTLDEGKSEILTFNIPFENFASYDDSGVTGYKSAFVLEEGEYKVFAGSNVRSAGEALSFNLAKLILIKQCEEAMAPVENFQRIHRDGSSIKMEQVPLATVKMTERRKERLPEEIKQVTETSYKLADVVTGKISMENFIAQFTDNDLSCIVRGEGMGSSLVTPGTASAYGGVTPKLQETFGIPACCCDDGPSGMRLDCGIKAFSLPNGTSLACTFDKELVTQLYTFTGMEMASNKVDNLLGPGMNIHRHPLNGRNFEYFSEDPLVTGEIGSAMLAGLRAGGVTGTIKHFCGNNQETNRRSHESVISERALREIYLKGFEIAVKNGADSVMTTYGLVNGVYTAGSYDLNTTILRKDLGFKGIVMTDWWANISEPDVSPDPANFAGMVKAQNDLYMCCPDGKTNASGDNTLAALSDGRITRAELQRTAMNVCGQAMTTHAMKRLLGTAEKIEIINRPKAPDDINLDDIEFVTVEKEISIDLTYQECKANTNYILAFDVTYPGTYEVTLTGSSELGELAQLPCTLFYQGIPMTSFTFNGTGGKDVSLVKECMFPTRFSVDKLLVTSNGLKLKSISFKYLNDNTNFFDL